ncbi:MAG: hypothetical protein KC420_01825 [Myxococcales bacterium]|nr:hypothetical protein [Myxococcales bacterium]MCB9566683.1 hydrocarbon-binding protein [Myxococcales bacterium]MCB9704414.1 hydrocarbon-binding protein [Myxococcales bacterium]
MQDDNKGPLRPTLGDFSSIVCFRALVVGIEDTIGEQAAMVAIRGAGRKRGRDLAHSLGFGATALSLDDALHAMRSALGDQGTRLCWVDAIEEQGEDYIVRLSETICSADEPQGSDRQLSFTMGAVHGALEVLTKKLFRSKQVGSVLRGDTHDVIKLSPR